MMEDSLLDDFLIANKMFVKEIYFRNLKKYSGQDSVWKNILIGQDVNL